MKKNRMIACALGDSISTAFNAKDPSDNLHHSWSTGDDYGHAARLAALYPTLEVVRHNVAFNGAKARDLKGQVDRLLPHAPDYVTLLIGANDLVHGLTLNVKHFIESFRAATHEAVARLVEASANVMIVAGGVPNQARLLDLLLPTLDPLFADQLRKFYYERWEVVNESLASLAKVYPSNYRFCPSVALTPFEREHLSPIDSYHPSVAGQKLLAELTWREGWF